MKSSEPLTRPILAPQCVSTGKIWATVPSGCSWHSQCGQYLRRYMAWTCPTQHPAQRHACDNISGRSGTTVSCICTSTDSGMGFGALSGTVHQQAACPKNLRQCMHSPHRRSPFAPATPYGGMRTKGTLEDSACYFKPVRALVCTNSSYLKADLGVSERTVVLLECNPVRQLAPSRTLLTLCPCSWPCLSCIT